MSGAIDIMLKGSYNSLYLSHEFKHAYQFEIGLLSFKSNGMIGDLYDLQDEFEAYKRGNLFGDYRSPNITKLSSMYPGIANNKTQRTLNSQVPLGGGITYRDLFKMREAAAGKKGVTVRDIYIDN